MDRVLVTLQLMLQPMATWMHYILKGTVNLLALGPSEIRNYTLSYVLRREFTVIETGFVLPSCLSDSKSLPRLGHTMCKDDVSI